MRASVAGLLSFFAFAVPGQARAAPDAPGFAEEQRLEASDSAEFDQLGYSVWLGNDRALVGAYGESAYRGAAYLFVRSGDAWTEEQKLLASDSAEGDDFGWSVSLADDRSLIGAYGQSAYRGAAYLFIRSGDAWAEEQKLLASDSAENDNFGWSVSLADDRALIGAYGQDSLRGAAYVFVKSNESWREEQKLLANDSAEGDYLGWSVSLVGDRALVGAPESDGSRGAAYLFVRSGSTWTEEQKLLASDGAADDKFGYFVSLADDRALVGAYWKDSLRGAAYVFVRSGSTWTEEQKLLASDGEGGQRFGSSVSLSTDRALIGAYANDSARGAAYLFVRSGGTWTEEQKLLASDGAENDLFGWSVSLAQDRALVGAHYDDNLRGAAYVFSRGLSDGEVCDGETPQCAPCQSDEDCALGPNAPGDGDGCGCRANGSPRHSARFLLGLVLGLMVLCQRRRGTPNHAPLAQR